jgi:hypothetical protein
MHGICCVNLPHSATARFRKFSLYLPHLSDFSLIKQVFRGALKSPILKICAALDGSKYIIYSTADKKQIKQLNNMVKALYKAESDSESGTFELPDISLDISGKVKNINEKTC